MLSVNYILLRFNFAKIKTAHGLFYDCDFYFFIIYPQRCGKESIMNSINRIVGAEKKTAFMHSHINQTKPKHAGNSGIVKEGKTKINQKNIMKNAIVIFVLSFIATSNIFSEYRNALYLLDVQYTPGALSSFYSLKTQDIDIDGYTIKGKIGMCFLSESTDGYKSYLGLTSGFVNFHYSNFSEESPLKSTTMFGIGMEYKTLSLADIKKLTGKNVNGSPISISLSYGGGLKWFSLKEGIDTLLSNYEYMGYLSDGIRLGTSNHAKIGIELYGITLSVTAERTFIMPRMVFWKETGNSAVSTIAFYVPDYLIDQLLSEIDIPLINFIVSNAYRYGVSQILKKNKSWPFDTPTPITIDEISFGITIRL